jgi:hypothetical protein
VSSSRFVTDLTPGEMKSINRLYNYPAHGVQVFDRVLHEQAALGHSLHSLRKGYVLGSGISFRFEFVETPSSVRHKLDYFYWRRREDSDPVFKGWHVCTALSMRILWVPIGYFYLLQEVEPNKAICAQCGGLFSIEEMIGCGGRHVCAGCKPVFLQRLAEGVAVQSSSEEKKPGRFWLIVVLAVIVAAIVLGLLLPAL